jgi:DNA-binding MarR family transcriptional regulator/predicted N-acetyltransferase YhbS
MTKDIIKQLGALAFASRLKRLSERLMQDVSRVYKEQDVEFEARWFPVAFILMRRSAMSVTDIAEALGLTHPAVSQIAALMKNEGLIDSTKDETDERRSLLALTAKGKKTLESLKPIWKAIEQSTAELLDSGGADLLSGLSKIERQLDNRDMYTRVTELIGHGRAEAIEIIDYQPQYREYFGAINREWLEAFFEVEDHDAAVLDDPRGTILRMGGKIVFARLHGDIVGTAALLQGQNGHFEIAKMGVTESARGHGVGRKLALHLIDRARQRGAREVVLATSPVLKAALSLYRSLGFREYEPHPAWRAQYKRHSVFLRLDLTTGYTPDEENPMERRRNNNA